MPYLSSNAPAHGRCIGNDRPHLPLTARHWPSSCVCWQISPRCMRGCLEDPGQTDSVNRPGSAPAYRCGAKRSLSASRKGKRRAVRKSLHLPGGLLLTLPLAQHKTNDVLFGKVSRCCITSLSHYWQVPGDLPGNPVVNPPWSVGDPTPPTLRAGPEQAQWLGNGQKTHDPPSRGPASVTPTRQNRFDLLRPEC